MLTHGILTFRVDDIVQSFGKGTLLSFTYLYREFLHDLMRGMLQRDKTRMESRHSGSATCRSPRPPVIERQYRSPEQASSHFPPGGGAATIAPIIFPGKSFRMKELYFLLAIVSVGSAEIATFSLPSPWSYTCDRFQMFTLKD